MPSPDDSRNEWEDEVRKELDRSRRDVEHQVRRGGVGTQRRWSRQTRLPVRPAEAEALDELERARQQVAAERALAEARRAAGRTEGLGWECPSCGKVYDEPGRCAVDGTPLRDVGLWHESVPEGSEGTEEVVAESPGHGPSLRR